MSKEIDLEKILSNISIKYKKEKYPNEIVFEAMKEACRQVLKLAAKNAELEFIGDNWVEIDERSILNTINQVK